MIKNQDMQNNINPHILKEMLKQAELFLKRKKKTIISKYSNCITKRLRDSTKASILDFILHTDIYSLDIKTKNLYLKKAVLGKSNFIL
jgi:hypothetical protein